MSILDQSLINEAFFALKGLNIKFLFYALLQLWNLALAKLEPFAQATITFHLSTYIKAMYHKL